jgi:virulence-associated protein VagC
MTNTTQDICLPCSVRFPDGVTAVDIRRHGRSLILAPSRQGWAAWFEDDGVSRDVMEDRAQPEARDRAAL